MAGIVIGCVVLALLIGTGIFAAVINGLDTIYPGVTVNGQDVSGLTAAQAEEKLGDYGKNGVGAAIMLPSEEIIEISAKDVGIPGSAGELAKAAMESGRSGGFVGNVLAYIKGMSGKTELIDELCNKIDENAVKAAVSKAVSEYNDIAGKEACEITEDKITIIKGAGQGLADENDVETLAMEKLRAAIKSGAIEKAEYTYEMGKAPDLDAIYNEIYVEPVSAAYDKDTGGVTPSVTGVSFDLEAAKKAYAQAKIGDTVSIDIIKTEPALTAENAEDLLFRDLLHNCVTTLEGSSSNRVTNIRLAAEAINGTVLNPGDEFSFNRVVGERTAARGFKTGTSYIGGKAVPDIGGGICQVSSSLYCCAIHNDLEIISRANHMFVVTYLPLGIDATVSWGTCDFVFKNTMDYPIKIEAYTNGSSSLTVNFYGTKTDDTYIKITSEVVGVRNYDTIEKTDSSLPAGTTKVETGGRTGYVVDLYRSFYTGDGELIRTEYLDRSDYSKQDRVVLVGPEPAKPAEPEQPSTPTEPASPEEPASSDDGSAAGEAGDTPAE